MSDLWFKGLDDLELVEGALRLSTKVDPTVNATWVELQLEKMLDEAELVLSKEVDEKARFDALLRLFYQEWGFQGDDETYFSSENAFIEKVLQRKKGIPVSLGALLLFFARKLGFPMHGISFPTQFLLVVKWPEALPEYINPFNGEYVAKHTLSSWLKGLEGNAAVLKTEHLSVADTSTVIGRWLAVLKGALMREEHYTKALACSNIALSLVPEDPYEIRDRGFIYQQLDCFQIARQDYQYFIDNCPEDPAAEMLKLQLKAINEEPVVLH
ncbi:SirB1 family protein [Vibrio rarus]|uniref:SirB1 family protein n=1 Tax=Vibrio rarus TaxID=413403 RepID=UPI0021C32EE1|nr:SirB1 family protein [Vibrio rarus]